MSIRFKLAWLTLGSVGIVVGTMCLPTKGDAIPAFARKYHTTCSRCHTAVPKLNSFGKNFQLYGYQQPGDQKVNKADIPEDKNLSLIDPAPIAFMVENDFNADRLVNDNQSPTAFETPTAFHIFGADSLAPDLGFFGEISTEDGSTDVGKVALTASFLGGKNISAQFGRLDLLEHGVTEHDLFSRSGYSITDLDLGGINLSEEHPGIRFFGTIGSNVSANLIHGKSDPSSQVAKNLSANANPMKTQDEEKESEDVDPMNILKGTLWEVGYFNSNAGGNASTSRDAGDFMARINAYFGGDSFVGAFGYAGRTTVGDNNDTNDFRLGGVDMSYHFGKSVEKTPGMKIKEFNLLGIYENGSSDNPLDTGEKVSWRGYMLELNKVIGGRAMALVKYDRVFAGDLLVPGDGSVAAWADGLNDGLRTNSLTVNYTYYIRTNLWAGLEYSKDLNSGGKNNSLGGILSFAF